MAKLVSSWYKEVKSLPESYILPPDERPGTHPVPVSDEIPVVDLERPDSTELILKACQEFGFFQVINHGVKEELMEEGMKVFSEFFGMAEEEKAEFYSEEPQSIPCVVSTSSGTNVDNEKVHFWRDMLRHSCFPLHENVPFWPQKPQAYREVVGECSMEVRKLGMRILEKISQGLGLKTIDHLHQCSKYMYLQVNHYPPCPDPTLSLGLYKHCDPTTLTILRQDSYGLQVLKDGQWIGVQPIPNAFVINVGHQLQVISNGKLKSAEHRAVTNSSKARTSAAFFMHPDVDVVVEPADVLVNESNPARYRAFQYVDFMRQYSANRGHVEKTIKPFEL
ncbi:Hyoscyamine 6-dioxygenase [Linum grandiflorum]